MWLLLACVDGEVAETGASSPILVQDFDGDGYPAEDDCDDDDPGVHPGAEDTPYDGVDADCSGGSDSDVDGDGYDAGDGRREDCDDADPAVNPGADEHCDGVDEDCDGTVDNSPTDGNRWYEDRDADGHGGGRVEVACEDPGDGWEATSTDCDDDDGAVHPGAEEAACSGADDDCDGEFGAGGVLGPDGTVYASIATALGAVADGDTVTVCEGALNENAVVYHPVTIEGMTGAELVGTGGAVLSILAEATVRGLALSGGSGWVEGETSFGGLVYVAPGISATLEQVDGRDGEADFGGCVSVGISGRLTMVDSSFDRCSATSLGGVLYAQDSVTLILEDVVLANGEARTAGGVLYVGSDATCALAGGRLQRGAASLGGGAYLGARASVTADAATTVQDSDAEYGGGLFLSDASSWTGGVIRQNAATEMGGGVYIPNGESDIVIEGADVEENSADWGGGFAVFGGVTLREVNVGDNDGDTGGGFYILDGGVTMDGGSCTGNNSLLWGGGASVLAAQYSASITVTASDWGTGGSDNEDEDVHTFSASGGEDSRDNYGADSTFSCSGASGC